MCGTARTEQQNVLRFNYVKCKTGGELCKHVARRYSVHVRHRATCAVGVVCRIYQLQYLTHPEALTLRHLTFLRVKQIVFETYIKAVRTINTVQDYKRNTDSAAKLDAESTSVHIFTAILSCVRSGNDPPHRVLEIRYGLEEAFDIQQRSTLVSAE